MTKVICFYSNIKTYIINSNDQNEHVRVPVSSSSMYKVRVYDISSIHVKSFYLHYIQSSQMSRGPVESPSSNTLRLR